MAPTAQNAGFGYDAFRHWTRDPCVARSWRWTTNR